MKDMSLKSLQKIFTEHSEKYREENKSRLKRYEEDFPDEDIPEGLLNDFDLPQALAFMCKELIEINKSLDKIRNEDCK